MSDDRLLATFLDLVRIDSPSGREAQVAGYCAAALRECGFDVCFDAADTQTGSDTGNLIAVLAPTREGSGVVLSAHMDCVQPCEGVEPVVEGDTIRSAGSTVLGADDKAGVATILECCRRLAESGRGHAGVRVVLTVQEEVGLRGAKALRPADVEGDLAVVLDADGAVGGIVTAAPTHVTFVATFHGQAAHAGVEPEKGVSAVRMAARAIAAMPLGRLDEETTANVGTVEGGTATNVIPAEARLTGECRSLDAVRCEGVRRAMDTTMRQAAEAEGGRVAIAWTKEYSGFRFSDTDEPVRLATAACRRAGVEPRTFSTGGGSDGNILAELGTPTLVLSMGVSSVHGTEETASVSELGRLAAVVDAIIDLAADA